MEQQHCAAGMSDAAENASASMLVPVNAPAVLSTNKQVTICESYDHSASILSPYIPRSSYGLYHI